MHPGHPALALALALGAAACTKTGPSKGLEPKPSPATTVSYYKDIKPLVEARCAGCHAPGDVAFSLAEPEAVLGKKAAVASAIEGRRMPVWAAAAGHEVYRDDPRFTADELALVAKWREQGFPVGKPEDDPGPASTGSALVDLDADLTLSLLAGEATYLPKQDLVDDYHCFIIPWPETEKKFMTGFQALPGNREIVHHLVAYKVQAELVPMLERLDAEEDGAGYRCFGGSMPDRLYEPEVKQRILAEFPEIAPLLKRRPSQWLGHWAPGMKENLLPEASGLPIAPGGAIVVQVHYYTKTAPSTADRGSEVRFKLADQVAKPGYVMPLTNDEWIDSALNRSLVVPPGGETTVSTGVPLEDLARHGLGILGLDPTVYQKMELHSANLHMHSYGKSARVFLKAASGEEDVLLAIDAWDLRWQRDFTLTQPKVFAIDALPQTELTVECTFANRTDREVLGGLGSDAEMCFDFGFIAFSQ